MPILETPDGLTVKKLKEYLAALPEEDSETGIPYEVWLGNKKGTSNQCIAIWPLNKTVRGSDIILEVV